MFRFEHPEYLWALGLIVLPGLAARLRRRLSAADRDLWGMPDRQGNVLTPRQQVVRLAGPMTLIALGVLALANPQWGRMERSIETRSADVYLLMDISTSMLAEDVAPSRLERARQLAGRITDALRSERIGLILFAGNAYVQSPLTTDWAAIRSYLQAADPSQAGTQGTAIADAFALVARGAEPGKPTGGLIVLLTDGEDHDDGAVAAIRDAARAGWVTHVVGLGTEAGGPIPILTSAGRDVKRDEKGEPVRTRLNSALLRELAAAGGGAFHDLSREREIPRDLRQAIDATTQRKAATRVFTEHRTMYAWVLLPAILLLLFLVFRDPNLKQT
jgi:Ca-activated chloride channel family protein